VGAARPGPIVGGCSARVRQSARSRPPEHPARPDRRARGPASPQLSSDVTGYLVDALLDWALTGRGYPQMALPDSGPDGDHLQELQRILERFPRRIAEAKGVAAKLELGRAGRLLACAVWASWDPQGVQDSIDRELVMAMPWLAEPPAPYELPDGRVL